MVFLGECEIPALDLAANYNELGNTTKENCSPRFMELGLDIDAVLIRNFKLPESVEKAMDERTSLGVISDAVDVYAKVESVKAMRDAAKNPGMGGTFAAAGMGIGVGAAIGKTYAESSSMSAAKQIKCAKCGSLVDENAKFCPNCGAPAAVVRGGSVCPKCGAAVSEGAKFCPECGEKLTAACPKCGTAVKPGVKFCPNCGEKLN